MEMIKLTAKKQWIKRISAILLMLLGVMFGGTWNKTGDCFGDHVFSAFGLSAWSDGTMGMHYPAIVSMFIILIGIAVLNTILSKKAQFWTWGIFILLLLVISFYFAYV